MNPRTIAIGDIHGCSAALDALVEAIRPRPEDCIVTLGDYINRGPDSRGVIERLIELNVVSEIRDPSWPHSGPSVVDEQRKEVGERHGFNEEVIEADRHRPRAGLLGRKAGEGDESHRLEFGVCSQAASDLKAIDIGQSDVEQSELRFKLGSDLECLESTERGRDVESGHLEHLGADSSGVGTIIDD
jgi:hypothetical protein